MKLLVILTSVLAVVFAQRPWYAGRSPIGYPGLASRFADVNDATTTPKINNRFDGPTEKIPIDARGDNDLVQRVNQWPRENRPFWILNADQIEAQRNTPESGQKSNRVSSQNLQSRFGGQSSDEYPDPRLYYSFGYDDFGNPVFYRY